MNSISSLPKTGAGENLFQGIKRVSDEAEAKGIKLFKLSIGQPVGSALLSARSEAARAIMSDAESMHEYQDNGEPGVPGFSQKFVQANVRRRNLSTVEGIAYLPIPGIKAMLGLIPMACNGITGNKIKVLTMTEPGYPVPSNWCDYLGLMNDSVVLNSSNKFLFNPRIELDSSIDLLMLNYPHNPSGQVATMEFWKEVCRYCVKYNIRIFNDAAYAMFVHSSDAYTLAEIAVDYPELQWIEAYSASKVIGNGTGWRVGAMAGHPSFINDVKTIKGNTDSGFNAALASGVLQTVKEDMNSIQEVGKTYKNRIDLLNYILKERGMRSAVESQAGFFTLWDLPRKAFGEEVRDAQCFNFTMIERTGIVGVHFHPYIRYAVVAPIETLEFSTAIKKAFDLARVEY